MQDKYTHYQKQSLIFKYQKFIKCSEPHTKKKKNENPLLH